MSLEDLQAQAEAEEETTEEQEPETQDEPEQEEAEDAEAEEGSSEEEEGDETEDEPSDDFELELDGEPEPGQQKPSPEEVYFHKMMHQRKKRQSVESERDELAERVRELEARINGSQPPASSQSRPKQPAQQYPPVPVLYEDGIDTKEQYTQAYQRWMAECKAVDQRNDQADHQKSEYKRQMEDMTHNLAKRLGKFASEHKIKDDRVISAAEKATSEIDEATKIEGSLAYLLDSVGDGGERVAYYIGTNEGAMAKVKELLQADSTGLKAVAHMTKLAEKLKPKHSSRTSKAPAPDRPIKGDGSPASQRKLQDEYDKASTKSDLKGMREILRKAEKVGVKLK